MKNLDKPGHLTPIRPGGVIGILGGGQLGRMLSMAASALGLKTCIYNDENHAPAFQVTPLQLAASYTDRAMLQGFAQICDVVTFEFENIPAESIEYLSTLKPVRPGLKALTTAQDRFTEKSFVKELGVATAPFFDVTSADDARQAFAQLGSPAILKTRRLGYDGKGQAKVASADAAAKAFESFKGAPAILEGFVDFSFEASVVAARGADGAFAAYDPPENEHENHILRRSTVPGRLTKEQSYQAKAMARKIAEALDYVGVLAVELFVSKDGALLVNEIAPRVHNSGHWTIEACACSQFEQHIRAIAGWPLGDPARHADAVMENIIGAEVDAWETMAQSGALHLYGKRQPRPGRKVGHVTRLKPKS
jgi:5-(carboxyamino)imidazole ribonucleotide synthase